MARIRTVKPEFWEDEAIGLLTRDARLLFVATWNLADDEGLLRWSSAYIKANVFMYDKDLDVPEVEVLMAELTTAGLIFAYLGGKARQRLGYVVNFRRHQNINRPQPGKLTPPSIQNGEVLQMYARRDGMECGLCHGLVETAHDKQRLWPSLDHIIPRSKGGTDYPSNLRLTHVSCNKARRERDDFTRSPVTTQGLSEPVHPESAPGGPGCMHGSVNGSVNDTPPEGKGREGKGRTLAPEDTRRDDERPARPTDEIWDAVMLACGVDTTSITKSARGGYNRAVADLKGVGATPAEVKTRARRFRQVWPNITLTPTALAKHWSALTRTVTTSGGSPPSANGGTVLAELDARVEAERLEAEQHRARYPPEGRQWAIDAAEELGRLPA